MAAIRRLAPARMGDAGAVLYKLRPAMNCLAVRGVRPGWRILPRDGTSRGSPDPSLARGKSIAPAPRFWFCQNACTPLPRRLAPARMGDAGAVRYKLRPAMNCLAVRGVRPGWRISHFAASARSFSRSIFTPHSAAMRSTISRNSGLPSAR